MWSSVARAPPRPLNGITLCVRNPVGTLFRYVSDPALKLAETDTTCDRCQSRAVSYEVEVQLDVDTQYEFHALCVDCSRSLPLRVFRARHSELGIQSAVNHHHPKGTLSGEQRLNRTVDICDEIRRTPKILMFLQNDDWPTCCGELTEFVGENPPTGHDYSEYECWDDPDSFIAQFKLSDFYPLHKMQVMRTMSLFHCLHCPSKYWVFQFSGLFWPGPLVDCDGRPENA